MGNNGKNICQQSITLTKSKKFTRPGDLKNQKNNLSRHGINITERLTEQEAVIKKAYNDVDLITTTHNCIVSVLVHNKNDESKLR